MAATLRIADPSPEEILSLCEEIQSGWTELERESRRFWTVERVQHSGNRKRYGQDAPLDYSLRRSLVADLPQLETPVVPMREVMVA